MWIKSTNSEKQLIDIKGNLPPQTLSLVLDHDFAFIAKMNVDVENTQVYECQTRKKIDYI